MNDSVAAAACFNRVPTWRGGNEESLLTALDPAQGPTATQMGEKLAVV